MSSEVERLALKVLYKEFDNFIGSCMDESGKPKKPAFNSLMRARGYLLPTCNNSFKNKKDQ